MDNNLHKWLVSTAEDFLYQGITDGNTIASSVYMTAARRGTELSDGEIRQVLTEAVSNYQEGKKTRTGLFGF